MAGSKPLNTTCIDNKNDSVKVTVLQNHLSIIFLAPEHKECLKKHHLITPEALWAYKGDWFETPNRKRGGWSGVNYLSLDGKGFYLKRQHNYQRRSSRHPIMGEPTYLREYKMLQYLQDKPVLTPELVYFAQNQHQSTMITAELAGFVSADYWLSRHADQDKKPLLLALARAVKALHQTGVEHRALFLKHLFVKSVGNGFEVAMIDFEKARRTPLIGLNWIFDVKRCLQRATQLTATDKADFLKAYWQTNAFNWWQQKLSRWLIKARKEKK